MRGRLRLLAIGLLALIALLASVACRRGAGEGGGLRLAAGTPVVLVSIDTLRSDHLPAYGYRGVETPAIDGLRRDSILYQHAYSHVPLTLPSHVSILTGLLPSQHGVRDNLGYPLDARRVPFLPSALKRLGYATGAGVSAFVLRGATGLATDFDLYDDGIEFRSGTGLGGLQRPGGETLEHVLPWLRSVANRPFFLFFHLYEPHAPYVPPEPFASRYPQAYDGEIASADEIVGRLLAELKRLGAYDRSLIFLLSDHGEGLGDHGEDEHGVLLYRESLQVPLLVKLPGSQRSGSSVGAPAELVDVLPTVASLLGLPLDGPAGAPARPRLAGISLLELAGAHPPAARYVYSETFYPRLHFGWSDLASLTGDRFHLIEGPSPELYDLGADPGERRNVVSEERRTYGELHRDLAGYDRALRPPSASDAETQKALAALGYVGSVGGVASGPLPDPKSQLQVLRDLKAAYQAFAGKRYEEATTIFRRVVADNPRVLDGWEFLGSALQALGRPQEALAAYQKALELSAGSPGVALTAASLFLELGRLDDAAAHARLAVDVDPVSAHNLLARVALARGNLDTAESEARAATEAARKSGQLTPRITLAEIAYRRGRLDEALALTASIEQGYAARKSPDPELIRGLYFLRGRALADLGRGEEAEHAFETEIGLFPRDPEPYTHLALLYSLTGRPQLVGPTLHRMVEASRSPTAYAQAVQTLRVVGDPRSAAALLRYALRLFPDDEALRKLGS